jgi:hypothetical protein
VRRKREKNNEDITAKYEEHDRRKSFKNAYRMGLEDID